MNIRAECVTSPQRLAEISDPWQALWTRVGADIFQHHHWISTWARGVADRRDTALRIMLAWKGDELVAVLPCAVGRVHGLRTLQWAAQLFTDYCDAMIDPGSDGHSALELLWNQVFALGGLDLVQLRCVRPDARIHRLLAREENALRIEAKHEQCLRIDCHWPDGDAYFRSLNKKARNNHTRGKRILEEIGGPISFHRIADGAAARSALDRLVQLKNAWMQVADPTSRLLGSDAKLLRSMLEASLDTGLATIFAITAGDRLVTASLNFVYDSKMQAYFTSYDPAFERASPGTILIVEYAKWAFDRQLRQVDFLRGDETFKFRLGNAETLLDGFVGGRSVLGHAAVAIQDWRRRVKRLREMPAVTHEPALPAA